MYITCNLPPDLHAQSGGVNGHRFGLGEACGGALVHAARGVTGGVGVEDVVGLGLAARVGATRIGDPIELGVL